MRRAEEKLELSDFEIAVFFASVVLGIISWGAWYRDIATVNDFRVGSSQIILLATIPLVSMVLLLVCLLTLSASTVRGSLQYVAMYLALGAAWLGVMRWIYPLLGISTRDDVLERGNSAANRSLAGALIGSCCAFIGANTGNGPGVEAVLFSAVLSAILFLGIWFGVEFGTRASEAVTVDRDNGAGTRLGGFLAAAGMLSGWAVAGTWISAQSTAKDLIFCAWPAVALGVLAIGLEHWLAAFGRSGRLIGAEKVSCLVAGGYCGLALIWIFMHGVKA